MKIRLTLLRLSIQLHLNDLSDIVNIYFDQMVDPSELQLNRANSSDLMCPGHESVWSWKFQFHHFKLFFVEYLKENVLKIIWILRSCSTVSEYDNYNGK